MSMRTIVIVVVVVMAFLGGIVWQSQMQKPVPTAATEQAAPGTPEGDAGQAPMPGQQVAEPPADASPGLVWVVPANWSTGEARPMRVATYGIPALAGDSEGAECAVFYFGPNQGGGAAENMDRWVGQFEHPSEPDRAQATINGFQVWRVHVTGDYLAPSGPMMQSSGTKKGYALLGAIVEGPSGRVFFKLTGPMKTVNGSKREFEDMLKTLKKS